VWPIQAAIAGALLVGVVLTAWAINLPQMVRAGTIQALSHLGYAVRDIDVRGVANTPRADVLKAAIAGQSGAAFGLDLDAMQARIEALPWVKSATVVRQLPDRLVITVTERTPFALWQRQGKLAVIDASGRVLANRDLDRFSQLPLVVGEGAPPHAPALFAMLEDAPVLRAQVDSVRWVGNRRWDIKFRSGELLMLPEGTIKARAALLAFAQLEAANGLLGKGFARFDLRLADRMFVRKAKEPAAAKDTAESPAAPAGTPI
jgi:cell division protein FtsQ